VGAPAVVVGPGFSWWYRSMSIWPYSPTGWPLIGSRSRGVTKITSSESIDDRILLLKNSPMRGISLRMGIFLWVTNS